MGNKKRRTGVRGINIINGRYIIDKIYKSERIYCRLDSIDEMTLDKAQSRLTQEMYKIDHMITTERLPDKSSLKVSNVLDYLWKKRLKHKPYAKDIKHILSSVDQRLGKKLLMKLKKSDIEAYIRDRSNDRKRNRCKGTISPRTVQKELQHLSMAINLLVDDGYLDRNSIQKFINVPQPRPQKVVLDDGKEYGDQWLKLEQAIAPSIHPILVTLYETGMRPKEVFNIRWHWLEKKGDDAWLIRVPAVDMVDGEIVFREKTQHEHLIPVSKPLLKILSGISRNGKNDLIFPAPRKNGARNDIESAFTNALIRSGLNGKGITPYTLRRTRLTIWDGIDPIAGMSAGGHVSKDIHYRHYVNLPISRLFKLVNISYNGMPGNGVSL